MNSAYSAIRQAAAIPIQTGRVCLVLSRSGKRWVVPKGNIEPGHSAGETALVEAWEEAGLVGLLRPEPIGSYIYEKCGQLYHVTVFVLEVTQVAESWPEMNWRGRRWTHPLQALRDVTDAGLVELMQGALADFLVEQPA